MQRNRGTSGFGFYLPETDRLTHNTKEGRILTLLKREKDAKEVLFHHRMPTSTPNVRNACHPFSTKDHFKNYSYVGIHNGVVSNTDELKKEHYDAGIKYVSIQENGRFNDSEALVWDFARFVEGDTPRLKASGSIAIIVVKRDLETGKALGVFFGHNHRNPLVMKKTEHSLTLSSEGDGDRVPENELFYYDYDTDELTKRSCIFPAWTSGGYNNYAGYNSGYGAKPLGSRQVPNYQGSTQQVKDVLKVQSPLDIGDTEPNESLTDAEWDNLEKELALNRIEAEVTRFLNEANSVSAEALHNARKYLMQIKGRMAQIDALTESDTEVEETVINEYCDLDEKFDLTRGVVEALKDIAKKEAPAGRQMGFHSKSTDTITKRNVVPLNTGSKALPARSGLTGPGVKND